MRRFRASETCLIWWTVVGCLIGSLFSIVGVSCIAKFVA